MYLKVLDYYSCMKYSFCKQVTPASATQPQHTEKVEPVAPQQQAETSKPATPAQITPPKVDYATDLFNMLSMDDANENVSKAAGATADDINWAGFQCMFMSLKKKKEKINSMEAQ